MSVSLRGKTDIAVRQILDALSKYEDTHPQAQIEAYRQNSYTIRARIIDPDFQELSWTDRFEIAWRLLENLPEDILSQMDLLVLLTPEEGATSFANAEFDHPQPPDE